MGGVAWLNQRCLLLLLWINGRRGLLWQRHQVCSTTTTREWLAEHERLLLLLRESGVRSVVSLVPN